MLKNKLDEMAFWKMEETDMSVLVETMMNKI